MRARSSWRASFWRTGSSPPSKDVNSRWQLDLLVSTFWATSHPQHGNSGWHEVVICMTVAVFGGRLRVFNPNHQLTRGMSVRIFERGLKGGWMGGLRKQGTRRQCQCHDKHDSQCLQEKKEPHQSRGPCRMDKGSTRTGKRGKPTPPPFGWGCLNSRAMTSRLKLLGWFSMAVVSGRLRRFRSCGISASEFRIMSLVPGISGAARHT